MGRNTGITGKLKEGDIIRVNAALRAEEFSYYKVNKVSENIAFTGFRNFNRNIYLGRTIYEYGKRINYSMWANTYTISNEKEAEAANAKIQ